MYSKALALCGLGVLAGAGALVDYWPVNIRFPLVTASTSAAPADPERAAHAVTPAARDEFDALLASVSAPSEPVRRLDLDRRPVSDESRTHSVVARYAPLPVVAAVLTVGTPLDVASLPAPAFVTARYELPVIEAAAPADLLRSVPARYVASPYAPPDPMADEDDGFLSSAFRKTGSSIVRTGVKTGTSLAGAVRVMGSVVRRAWPN